MRNIIIGIIAGFFLLAISQWVLDVYVHTRMQEMFFQMQLKDCEISRLENEIMYMNIRASKIELSNRLILSIDTLGNAE